MIARISLTAANRGSRRWQSSGGSATLLCMLAHAPGVTEIE